MLLVGNRHTSEDKTWEFRHPNFRKGEVHLLSSIRRRVHNNPPPLPPEVRPNTDPLDHVSSPPTNLQSIVDSLLSRVNHLEDHCLNLNNSSKKIYEQYHHNQSLQLDQLKVSFTAHNLDFINRNI